MTDRIRHLTVTLDRDYRDDDVAAIADAIRQLRGVVAVDTVVVTVTDMLARVAVAGEIRLKLHEAIESVFADHEKRP